MNIQHSHHNKHFSRFHANSRPASVNSSNHIRYANNNKFGSFQNNIRANNQIKPQRYQQSSPPSHHIITDEEQAIHDKYLSLLTPYNMPPKLLELARISKQKHKQTLAAKKAAKKNQIRINVSLPVIQGIKSGHRLSGYAPINKTIAAVNNYKTALQNHAVHPIFSKGIRPAVAKKLTPNIRVANRRLKRLVNYTTQKAELQKTNSIKPTILNYIKFKSSHNRLSLNKSSLIPASFTHYKKVNNKIYQQQIKYFKQKLLAIAKPRSINKKFKPIIPFKIKPQPLRPWIKQGRQQYEKLKRKLLRFKIQLKLKRGGLRILTRKNRKIIRQFRRKRKFSKFGKYGAQSKFIRELALVNARALTKQRQRAKPKRNVKRQSLYLQHKRLSTVNNSSALTHKYMHMLIIIWYILMKAYIPLYKDMLKSQMWLTYFFRNVWISHAGPQAHNLYLNYGISNGPMASPSFINIYMPSRNPINNELQIFKFHQRLTANLHHSHHLRNNSKYALRLKRRAKFRGFFRISPKLKAGHTQMVRGKFNKHFKNKNKRNKLRGLADKEWLLVKKFTRRNYQHQFPFIFSQWKNIKKIQKYIDKQSYGWHQSYVLTHPYYYTARYKTFVYQTTIG